MTTAVALQRSLRDLVDEYDAKCAAAEQAVLTFKEAVAALGAAATIGVSYGGSIFDRTPHVSVETIRDSLRKSAFRDVYDGLNIPAIATATDKKKLEQMLERPPAFTLQNIRDTFGDYIVRPRHHILRGLAELFCQLDPAYKSHDKVKIGVAGLPKRVIFSGFHGWSDYGRGRLRDILNAIASYQGISHPEYTDLSEMIEKARGGNPATFRGATLKIFNNGNAHLSFDRDTLKDVNRALAEWYGDVLPDAAEEKPAKKQASTAVSRDLQYYPTPKAVVEEVVRDLYNLKGQKVLEPSCGCGRFLDALRSAGADCLGIEVDPARAAECRAKGHSVLVANFLETAPSPIYDRVVMNPPFYGKHYAKHVEHARRYLKPGGVLTAILPITARYDHGLLNGQWDDLGVGAFSESGTNVNTTVLTLRAAP